MYENLVNFLALVMFGYLFSIRKSYIGGGIFMILWNFFGVFLHELCHYLMALFLNGKPKFPNLIPKKESYVINGIRYDFWTLGYVEVRNLNAFNSFFIGFAPVLILFPLAFYVYLNFFNYFEYNWLNIFLFYITIYLILYNSMPSKQDLKVASKGYLGFITFIFLIWAIINFRRYIV